MYRVRVQVPVGHNVPDLMGMIPKSLNWSVDYVEHNVIYDMTMIVKTNLSQIEFGEQFRNDLLLGASKLQRLNPGDIICEIRK